MKKILALCCFFSLTETTGYGQATGVDRNKLTVFFQNQDFEGAIAYLQPFATQDSTDTRALNGLGYAYYMKDDISAADKYYRAILRVDSNHIGAMQYLVAIHKRDDAVFAASLTRKLILLQPANAGNYRKLGEFFARAPEKDSARLYLSKALLMSPNDIANGASFAEWLIGEKEYREADSILDAGLGRDSLIIAYLKLRVRSAYDGKKYADAVVPGERLVRLGYNSQATLVELVVSYYNLRMYDDCIRVSDYMQNRDIATESVFYYEAKAYAKQNQFAKSNELLQICLSKAISRTSELYYYNLGDNFESLKQYKKAISCYDSAFYLFRNPVMKYNCGRIYETRFHNNKLAARYYREYLALAEPGTADEQKAYNYVKLRWGKNSKPPSKAESVNQ